MQKARTGSTLVVATALSAVVAMCGLVRPAPAAVRYGADDLPPMFTEIETGVTVPSFEAYGAVGFALRAAFGVGVTLEDLPLALYVTTSFTWTHLADTRRSAYQTADLVNDAFVYAFGLRGVTWLSERLELILDVQGGYRRASASSTIDGGETWEMTEGSAVPIVGVGARYAFLDWLTAGLRWECLFLPPMEGPDVPATAAGLTTPRGERWQMNIVVNAAAHF